MACSNCNFYIKIFIKFCYILWNIANIMFWRNFYKRINILCFIFLLIFWIVIHITFHLLFEMSTCPLYRVRRFEFYQDSSRLRNITYKTLTTLLSNVHIYIWSQVHFGVSRGCMPKGLWGFRWVGSLQCISIILPFSYISPLYCRAYLTLNLRWPMSRKNRFLHIG